jgi:hypothetical protein
MKNRFRYCLSLLTIFLPLIPVIANQTKGDSEAQTGSAVPLWVAVAFIGGLVAGALLIYFFSRWKIYSILSVERHKYLHDLKEEKEQDIITGKFFRYIGVVMLLKKSKDKKVKLRDLRAARKRPFTARNYLAAGYFDCGSDTGLSLRFQSQS